MLVTSHTYASSQSWTPQAGLTESFDRPKRHRERHRPVHHRHTPSPGRRRRNRHEALDRRSSADVGNTHILALRRFIPNVPPTVSLTSPTSGASFTAPASVTLAAAASD